MVSWVLGLNTSKKPKCCYKLNVISWDTFAQLQTFYPHLDHTSVNFPLLHSWSHLWKGTIFSLFLVLHTNFHRLSGVFKTTFTFVLSQLMLWILSNLPQGWSWHQTRFLWVILHSLVLTCRDSSRALTQSEAHSIDTPVYVSTTVWQVTQNQECTVLSEHTCILLSFPN